MSCCGIWRHFTIQRCETDAYLVRAAVVPANGGLSLSGVRGSGRAAGFQRGGEVAAGGEDVFV